MTVAAHETRAGPSPANLEQGANNPVDHCAATGQNRNNTSELGVDGSGNEASGRLDPSHTFTHHQLFYIFFLDGLGGMLLSGGVNFALAFVMYTAQDTVKNPIRLFRLPNTLAGDAAVTIVVQCILTWFVEKGLVAYDLSRRSVQPIGFIPKPSVAWHRKLFFLPPLTQDATHEKPRPENEPKPLTLCFSALASLLQQALRGFLLAIAGFFLLWPASVGILTAFGDHESGDYVFTDRWTPQIFKLILGGLLGLLTTPLMAMFWLIKAGWDGEIRSNPEP